MFRLGVGQPLLGLGLIQPLFRLGFRQPLFGLGFCVAYQAPVYGATSPTNFAGCAASTTLAGLGFWVWGV